MREDHRVDSGGIEREMAVGLARLVAPAVIDAAIEKDGPAANEHDVHRTGDRPGGSIKLKVHGNIYVWKNSASGHPV
jgi:hypothetical protein